MPRRVLALALLLTACGASPGARPALPPVALPEIAEAAQPTFESAALPFIERHCVACHGAEDPESGLSLARYRSDAEVLRDFRTWDVVAEYVRDGSMPPETEPRPPVEQSAAFLAWLDATLERADRRAPPDPGRVTMRRMNRVEYRNTVRDLLGVDYEGVRDFPADDVGYGFDNVGDVLTLPPLLLERYLTAAEEISYRALSIEDPDNPPEHHFPAGELPTTTRGGTTPDGGRYFSTNGLVTATVSAPRDGEYVLRVVAWGMQAGPDPCRMDLRVDARTVERVDVPERRNAAGTFEKRVRLTAGRHRLGAAFVNDYYKPDAPRKSDRDRNLAVESITLVGPIDPRKGPLPDPHRRLLAPGDGIDDPAARRSAILRALCDRAFRRPATDDEIERLAALWLSVEESETSAAFERGLRVALQAVLVSPHFLFRVERHPHPEDPAWVRDLDDFALASRLSYFLWSTMPDERLLALARDGRLRATLAAELERMLDDPRADELIRNFGSQWLETRRLDTAVPDPNRFPDWDEDLRSSMQRESELFLRAVLREGRSAKDIVAADWTFVNARLAEHYGLEEFVSPSDDAWARVGWDDDRRGGVLGHAGILTVTSYPTRTSPVKRAKWLLEQIAGDPTPPPPPGAGDLPEEGEGAEGLTLRERLERHRADPSCAVCHDRMDPLGFALENFDPVGRWRTEDDGGPIDATGVLPDGTRLASPADLRRALLADDAFVRNLTAKLLTYALGRGPLPSDPDVVAAIVDDTREGGYRLRDLIVGVATSEPFRRHRGERVEPTEDAE